MTIQNKVHSDIALLIKEGSFMPALSLSEKAVINHPKSSPLALQHLRLLMHLGRLNDAIAFSNQIPVQMRHGNFIYPFVQLLVATGKAAEAHSFLSKVQEVDRTSIPFQLARLALCKHEVGINAAIKLADELCSLYPQREMLWQQASTLREHVLSPKDMLKWLLEKTPDRKSRPLRTSIVRAYIRTGSLIEAKQQLLAMIEDFGADAQLFTMLVNIHSECDGLERALEICEESICFFPKHPGLAKLKIDLLIDSGRRNEALELAEFLSETNSKNMNMMLNLANIFLRMGEVDRAETILEDVDERGVSRVQLALAISNLYTTRMDVECALKVLRSCLKCFPENTAIRRRIDQIEFNNGISAMPSLWLKKQIEEFPNDVESSFTLARQYIVIGELDVAESLLNGVSENSSIDLKRKNLLLADIALERGNLSDAIDLLEPQLERFPGWLEGRERMVRALLLNGQIHTAWTMHSYLTKRRAEVDLKKDKSSKALYSIDGQILNEFRLLGDSLDLKHCTIDADPNQSIDYFKAAIDAAPNSTPSALLLLSSLRRADRLVTRPRVKLDDLIPRNLFQFWDSPDPPKQLLKISNHNARLNPDFTYRLFNQIEAENYLKDKGEYRAHRAFRLAPHPAGKADIFRLALLFHDGGVYIDADDKCLLPLSHAISLKHRFVGYQEYFMSVGNNFLAVRPFDPFIRSALDDASSAFDGTQGETLWLSTGPGVLTRSFARHLVTDKGELEGGVQLLTAGKLRRFLVSHMPLSYKTGDKHWTARFKRINS